jgi:transcriptional regulator with XRE-family HTH domain
MLLRTAMDEADVGISELAARVGVNRATIYRYLQGTSTPGRNRRRLLASHLGVPFDYFDEVIP